MTGRAHRAILAETTTGAPPLLGRLASFIQPVKKHLGTALKDFRHVASVFPSTRFAIHTVLSCLPEGTKRVLEYGPGTGNVTRAILARLPGDGSLTAVELNAEFVPALKRMGDPRLTVVQGSVLAVLPSVKALSTEGVDAVISGIPFSMIPADERENIFLQTRKALRPGGRFIVYQNSRLLVPLFRKHFDQTTIRFEPRNFLPYFIITGTLKS